MSTPPTSGALSIIRLRYFIRFKSMSHVYSGVNISWEALRMVSVRLFYGAALWVEQVDGICNDSGEFGVGILCETVTAIQRMS